MRKPFEALELSLEIIPHLRKLLPAIREHDRKLHEQIRDAGSSMPLNLFGAFSVSRAQSTSP